MSKLKLFTLAAASMLAAVGSADNSWTAGQAVGGGRLLPLQHWYKNVPQRRRP